MFQLIKNYKSALSEKMDNFSLGTDLQECGLELIKHSPFSPDLSPSGFYLFPRIKTELSHCHLNSSLYKQPLNSLNVESEGKGGQSWYRRSPGFQL